MIHFISEKKKLADIVPPVKLCLSIPEGFFEDSFYVWYRPCNEDSRWEVLPRAEAGGEPIVPAPTFEEIAAIFPQEIMEKGKEYYLTFSVEGIGYSCKDFLGGRDHEHYFCGDDDRLPTAALRLFLSIQGRMVNVAPLLTIVRGLPGSGKTTFGRELAAKQNGLFIEPDMFMYDSGGRYVYSEKSYEKAQSNSRDAILEYFRKDGRFAVYADVLPTREAALHFYHFLEYRLLWREMRVKVIDMPKIPFEVSKARNVHNVCEKDLKRMFEQWEDWK